MLINGNEYKICAYADLRGADLRDADLRCADLLGACLRDANLRRACLRGACLRDADLRGADLSETVAMPQCPEKGPFVAWKKAGKFVVKLEIPADAKRSSATSPKCRASAAKTIEIQNPDGTRAGLTHVKSERGGIYEVGKMTYPDSFDEDRWNECSNGLHFFLARENAVNY